MVAADLRVENASWAPRKGAPLLLHPLSFEVGAGRVLGVVGANGAGKSTLLRMLYRFNRPVSGRVFIGDEDIWSLSPRVAAQRVAAVLQEQPTDFSLNVREIVSLGRNPYRVGLVNNGAKDAQIISNALNRLDLQDLAGRRFGTLSGGERQRVMVARALTQEPQVLVLDEPTNHLDIRHQLEIIELIRSLNLTIVTSLHDLNIAALVCDDILVLKKGHALCFGPPTQVLTETVVSQAFQVDASFEQLSKSGLPHFTYKLNSQG
ncbi:ABC transporter ATP-binding protein [Pseudovibrio sp. Tun.PSC04-5.I4]|uniref:ABC transporter ATP-binding protein n=1 Tax=Pseudovibrio sp. Tun.PSC04-5.I4 TaxID=1798213 RepID=UPI000B80F66E|nr:ABC transporter ATP-binding protein [Pseudovibrio sp. Tun.PSC04-5.I4]